VRNEKATTRLFKHGVTHTSSVYSAITHVTGLQGLGALAVTANQPPHPKAFIACSRQTYEVIIVFITVSAYMAQDEGLSS
jgi:hypothetical protein